MFLGWEIAWLLPDTINCQWKKLHLLYFVIMNKLECNSIEFARVSQTRRGSQLCKVCSRWMQLWNSLNYGIFCLMWNNYNLMLMILIFENSHKWIVHGKVGLCFFSQRSVRMFSWEMISKTWALGKGCFFMWLSAHNRCWTAHRIARRGLDHPLLLPSLCLGHRDYKSSFGELFLLHEIFGLACCRELACKASHPSKMTRLLRVGGSGPLRLLMDWQEKAWTRSSFYEFVTLWNHKARYVFDGVLPNLPRISWDCGNCWCQGISYLTDLLPEWELLLSCFPGDLVSLETKCECVMLYGVKFFFLFFILLHILIGNSHVFLRKKHQ